MADAQQRGDEVTSTMAARLRAHDLAASTVTVEGPADWAIVDEAKSWSADLVVVGTRGNGLLRRLLLGSTARSVLHHAGASVLITKPIRSVVPEPETASDPADMVPA